jgi:ATP-dependent HslUV protease subunit HslV
VKHDAKKIRPLADGKVLCGFAGSAADAFALLDRFESKLRDAQFNILRAAVELAKDWRTDKVLRHLQSMLVAVAADRTLILSGNGDVIEPTDGVVGIGSGGNYAVSAARALLANTDFDAATIVQKSLEIAGDICVYTNRNIVVETLTA